MATTAETEAALAKLRATRAKLFEVSQLREAAVLRRTRINASVLELNTMVSDARADMLTARAELAAILATPEEV